MQEKKHQLSKYQLSVIEKVKKSKENEQRGNFLILEQSKQKFIFESDITPTSKLLLIYFLSKIDFNHRHLYIHASYAVITKETTIIKSTIMRSIKELQAKGFIKLLSGKNRVENTLIKEFIFGQKQNIYDNQNQTNIVEMTPFFEQFFKGAK
ncbi:MAG: hypothetical protein WC272_11235 [Sulfurimonas sp.]|jgi:hypothetical protein